MLALAFLLLIGMALIADGFDVHVPRGYIYFAMAFASAVEVFNVLAQRNRARNLEGAQRIRLSASQVDLVLPTVREFFLPI